MMRSLPPARWSLLVRRLCREECIIAAMPALLSDVEYVHLPSAIL